MLSKSSKYSKVWVWGLFTAAQILTGTGLWQNQNICYGKRPLKKGFLVLHVHVANTGLTYMYHSIHVRQRDSVRLYFDRFLVPLPAWWQQANRIYLQMLMVVQSPFLQHVSPRLCRNSFPPFSPAIVSGLLTFSHVSGPRPKWKQQQRRARYCGWEGSFKRLLFFLTYLWNLAKTLVRGYLLVRFINLLFVCPGLVL